MPLPFSMRSGPARASHAAVPPGVFPPWLGVLAVALLDQLGKAWALTALRVGEPRPLVGQVVRLLLLPNSAGLLGVAFGPWTRGLYALGALLLLAVLGTLWYRPPGGRSGPWWRPGAGAVSLVGGGALGNLIDRTCRAGGVVDYLDVGLGPWRAAVANLADVALVAGVLWLVWQAVRGPTAEGQR